MNQEDCLKLAELIETDEEWFQSDFSDVELAQALRSAATLDRITAERDGLRKALENLNRSVNRMFATNPHQRLERNAAIADVEVKQRAAVAALAVSDADRQ